MVVFHVSLPNNTICPNFHSKLSPGQVLARCTFDSVCDTCVSYNCNDVLESNSLINYLFIRDLKEIVFAFARISQIEVQEFYSHSFEVVHKLYRPTTLCAGLVIIRIIG